MAHKEFGFQQVEKLIQNLMPFGHPDAPAKLIGKGINVMLSPLPRAKRARNPRESAHQNGEATPPAKAETTHHAPPIEQRTSQPAPVSSQPFSNNAFADLELKTRQ